MFLGYQNDKIAFIAETREELENMPCVTLDKIEETTEEYAFNVRKGKYMLKAEVEAEQKKAEAETRIEELKAQLVASDYVVLKITEALDEAEKTDLLEKYADVLKSRREARVEINKLAKEYGV